jgi:CheY-like chemotaxis protein
VEVMTSLEKKRILCVDDAEDDCVLYSLILTEAGYEVELAQSFGDALNRIENSLFSLFLFDLSLWDGTGFQLLEKSRVINPSIPVIICSADARDSIRQQVIQTGAQAFFTKPIDFDFLVESIAQILD